MKTIYERLIEAGIEVEGHESDMYVRVTKESMDIIGQWEVDTGALRTVTFAAEPDGARYYDLPFQYTPYWDAKAKTGGYN